MISNCPECNFELDSKFKFCPNCGANLERFSPRKESSKQISADRAVSEIEFILCENCGEENVPDGDYCDSCGVKLESKEIQRKTVSKETAKPKSEPRIQEKRNKPEKPRNKKAEKPTPLTKPVKSETKKIERLQFIAIFSGAAAIILLILLLSDVFSSSPAVNQQSAGDNQQPRIDLSNIQKINELEAKVAADSNDMKSLLELAHLKNDSGFHQKAIENYRKYLSKNPSDADARIDMGVCYFELKDYNTAIAEMEKALEYQPNHQIGHLNLGVVNLNAGNSEKAKEWFQKTININPNTQYAVRARDLLNSL